MDNIPKAKNFKGLKNQFITIFEDGVYFQSYDTMIVKVDYLGEILLDQDYWRFGQTQTTNKHFYAFLKEHYGDLPKGKVNKEYINKLIENGVIKLTQFNK